MNSTVIVKLNLNTSHVLINLYWSRLWTLVLCDLNTSHVLINQNRVRKENRTTDI